MIDLTGKKFGRLTVSKISKKRNSYNCLLWECNCSCGKLAYFTGAALRKKNNQSCGCLTRDSFERTASKGRNWKGFEEIPFLYFNQVKKNAKSRKLVFKLTIKDFWNLFVKQEKKCALTGTFLKFKNKNEEGTASLDRIDSSRGYTIDNIQWIHKNINLMKQDLSESDFFHWIMAVVKYKGLQ